VRRYWIDELRHDLFHRRENETTAIATTTAPVAGSGTAVIVNSSSAGVVSESKEKFPASRGLLETNEKSPGAKVVEVNWIRS